MDSSRHMEHQTQKAETEDYSFEQLALLGCTRVLTSAIATDPLSVANKLMEAKLASSVQVEKALLQTKTDTEKATELVLHILRKVGSFPEKYDQVLGVLKEFSWMEDAVKAVEDKYTLEKDNFNELSGESDSLQKIIKRANEMKREIKRLKAKIKKIRSRGNKRSDLTKKPFFFGSPKKSRISPISPIIPSLIIPADLHQSYYQPIKPDVCATQPDLIHQNPRPGFSYLVRYQEALDVNELKRTSIDSTQPNPYNENLGYQTPGNLQQVYLGMRYLEYYYTELQYYYTTLVDMYGRASQVLCCTPVLRQAYMPVHVYQTCYVQQ